jgi:aspartate kinase
MKVFKFGGASVRSAEGIRNIQQIVTQNTDDLFIVISAMGKTTNAMEEVLAFFMAGKRTEAHAKLTEVEAYHIEIIDALFDDKAIGRAAIADVFAELNSYIDNGLPTDYDRCYDYLVSFGEVISTKIISEYLNFSGVQNVWLDMRKLLVTDSNFREANVRMDESERRLSMAANFATSKIYIGQGFIGTNILNDVAL